ncbi:MAG: hypothetical protein QM778_24355 [Myxococcales bacterium]
MRSLALCLLLAGCSVDLQGVSSGTVEGDGDGPDQEKDAHVEHDANSSDAHADPEVPDADLPRQDAQVAQDAGPTHDAATPSVGYQPPAGQIGSRCNQNSDCDGFLTARCAKDDDLIGSDTGYCTRTCTANGAGNQCGAGAICISVNGSGTCQRYCKNDNECRLEDDYHCVAHPILQYGLCWQ